MEYLNPLNMLPSDVILLSFNLKKDSDDIRLCIDFKGLNKFIAREIYQTPTSLDVVTTIPQSEVRYFSTVDGLSG